MAEEKKSPTAGDVVEAERIRQDEVDKLRKKDEDIRTEGAAAREAGAEQARSPSAEGSFHGDARPATDVPAPQSLQPTFPNVPTEGFRRNPANQQTMMPPERQAPRPADDALIGQGRVKPSQQPASEK
jgi:hypothetical protein